MPSSFHLWSSSPSHSTLYFFKTVAFCSIYYTINTLHPAQNISRHAFPNQTPWENIISTKFVLITLFRSKHKHPTDLFGRFNFKRGFFLWIWTNTGISFVLILNTNKLSVLVRVYSPIIDVIYQSWIIWMQCISKKYSISGNLVCGVRLLCEYNKQGEKNINLTPVLIRVLFAELAGQQNNREAACRLLKHFWVLGSRLSVDACICC